MPDFTLPSWIMLSASDADVTPPIPEQASNMRLVQGLGFRVPEQGSNMRLVQGLGFRV